MLDRRRSVFTLIALAGVLPSALVLWFTSVAIRNEQLASAQIEEQARQVLMSQTKSELIADWNARLAKIDERIAGLPPPVAFHESVNSGGVDGLVILVADNSSLIAYPGLPNRTEGRVDSRLASGFAAFAAAIQRNERDKVERAAQALLADTNFERSIDGNGRHMLSNIELLILESGNEVSKETQATALSSLTHRLNNYRFDLIPGSQRRFLMSRVAELTSTVSEAAIRFPTMAAESLSARYVEANPNLIAGPYLNRSRVEGVWQQRLPSGRGIALFGEQRIRTIFGESLAAMDNSLAEHIRAELVPESSTRQSDEAEIVLGAAFPGWRLRVVDQPNAAGPSLKWIYVALSVASVVLILLVLFVIASMTLRRLALAQQKNTMVATVSHELKTPVSSIKLLVDTLLQDEVMRPDRVREYLHLISRENLRLSQVIENVLSFSRIERTKFKIEKQPLDVRELIREAVTTFSQQTEIAKEELTVDVAADIPVFNGDAWALNRVILNLLDNAYKFSDPPRRIQVSARVENPELVVSMSDTGVGIRNEDVNKVFDQFYQADQRLSRSNEGCGLGLSIVKHIVTLHGGTIAVQSEIGVGSVFTVRLPLEQG